jgi:uncharacterized protein
MNMIHSLAARLNIPHAQVQSTVQLLDEDNTIPFIARYRKEATGGLDEVQLREIAAELKRLRSLAERRESILESLREQDQLTPELEKQLLAADSRTELEDLYQPYRPKRTTRASQARELGLTGLAEQILAQPLGGKAPETAAEAYLTDQVENVEHALQGARDIAAEKISDHPRIRQAARKKAFRSAVLGAEKRSGAEDPRGTYQNYTSFSGQLQALKAHQVLALDRGEEEKVLRISLEIPERCWRKPVQEIFPVKSGSPYADQLDQAAQDAADRLLLPAITRDLRRKLTETAQAEAVQIFAENVRSLLLQPPLAGRTVLGLDPGFRTGCKAAVVDPTGKPLGTATIYPVPPRSQPEQARKILASLIAEHGVSLIAIGNGTASRETEQFVAELTAEREDLHYLVVSETGASVYSASELAGRELPEMDVSLRGAVSIARRVQDPLAELVKIDPRSLGVGMYQHDLDQGELSRTLDEVVESVVNQVGVDLNTASPALLTHISGIGPALADRLVAYREEHGPFQRRQDLLDVRGLGAKTFQQAAGFLRIREGDQPLDATAIHPESYPAAEEILNLAGISLSDPPETRRQALKDLSRRVDPTQLSDRLDTGIPTLKDIFQQLAEPGRDPREDLPRPILRSDVLTMEDLTPGMELRGTVRNVVAFGAFVDLGVKQDGLLHISQIPGGEKPAVGDVLTVQVLKVEPDRGRIGLGWADR